MDGCSLLESQARRRSLALFSQLADERFTAGVEEALYPHYLGVIFGVCATLEARRKTHFHFGIDTTGKFWIGIEVVDAASHLEKVERIIGEFFSSRSRREWPVVQISPTAVRGRASSRGRGLKAQLLSQPGGHRRAWIHIFQVQFYQRCRTNPQPGGVSLRKNFSQQSVQQKLRLKIRPNKREFELAHAIAKTKPPSQFGSASEQALQPPPQICGLADVGLTFATEKENRCRRRNLLEKTIIPIRRE